MPMPLSAYRRDFTPELEAGPREPVYAVDLVSPKGVRFTLVREALGTDRAGRKLAWLVWRGDACVGYVATTPTNEHWPIFDPGMAPYPTRRHVKTWRAVAVWRSLIADGTGSGTGGDDLARVPSRGLGIMWAAYVEIVRQLSACGWCLSSNPKARSPEARALWRRLAATPGVEIVRSRAGEAKGRELAVIPAPALAAFAPAPDAVIAAPFTLERGER